MLPVYKESSSVPYPSPVPYDPCLGGVANSGRTGTVKEVDSAMLVVPPEKPYSTSRERRLGSKTLSSLALPSIDIGSSCSLSMLKRAERLGMIRLVRKLSDVGRTNESSGRGAAWGCCFFHLQPFFVFVLIKAGEGMLADGRPIGRASSLALFLVRKRFIAN